MAKPAKSRSKKPVAKASAKKSAARKTAARKPAAPKSTKSAKQPATKATAPTTMPRRADYGAPIHGYFVKQPEALRPIHHALRALIEEIAPDATAALKWGMPWFMLNGGMFCAITGHKAHVNLILPGPPGTYSDPDNLLTGEGKIGKHLKVLKLADLPTEQVKGWLRTAAARHRATV